LEKGQGVETDKGGRPRGGERPIIGDRPRKGQNEARRDRPRCTVERDQREKKKAEEWRERPKNKERLKCGEWQKSGGEIGESRSGEGAKEWRRPKRSREKYTYCIFLSVLGMGITSRAERICSLIMTEGTSEIK
jgi:hypothetical protein